jgi:hypothetical protein
MPKYISFFSYTRDAVNAMIAKPSDRGAAAKALVESVGGKLECFYWMHGPHDGFFIADYKAGSTGAVTIWKPTSCSTPRPRARSRGRRRPRSPDTSRRRPDQNGRILVQPGSGAGPVPPSDSSRLPQS